MDLNAIACGIDWPLLRYTLYVATVFVLVNMAPAYYLDGQWALVALVEIATPGWTGERKAAMARNILVAGSALLVLAFVLSAWSAITQ